MTIKILILIHLKWKTLQKVQLGMVTEQTPETFAEQQPKVLPKIQASSERSVPVDTQQAKVNIIRLFSTCSIV